MTRCSRALLCLAWLALTFRWPPRRRTRAQKSFVLYLARKTCTLIETKALALASRSVCWSGSARSSSPPESTMPKLASTAFDLSIADNFSSSEN